MTLDIIRTCVYIYNNNNNYNNNDNDNDHNNNSVKWQILLFEIYYGNAMAGLSCTLYTVQYIICRFKFDRGNCRQVFEFIG